MKKRFLTVTAILLFVSVGLACSFLRPKSPLTWHILLEIDPGVPDLERTVGHTVSVIERRLNAAGVNSMVLALGTPPNGQILISLTEVPDRKRLTHLVTSQGTLELVAVVSPPSPSPVQTYSTEQDALASFKGSAPGSRRVLPYQERAEPTTAADEPEASQQPAKWVVVEAPAIVDGSDLRNAEAIQRAGLAINPLTPGHEEYQISFSLGPEGAQKFGAWTGAHINEYLGVVLSGEVKSIAYIKSQISDQGEISGNFTKESAEDLALILRSGGLPAPVKVVEVGNDNRLRTRP